MFFFLCHCACAHVDVRQHRIASNRIAHRFADATSHGQRRLRTTRWRGKDASPYGWGGGVLIPKSTRIRLPWAATSTTCRVPHTKPSHRTVAVAIDERICELLFNINANVMWYAERFSTERERAHRAHAPRNAICITCVSFSIYAILCVPRYGTRAICINVHVYTGERYTHGLRIEQQWKCYSQDDESEPHSGRRVHEANDAGDTTGSGGIRITTACIMEYTLRTYGYEYINMYMSVYWGIMLSMRINIGTMRCLMCDWNKECETRIRECQRKVWLISTRWCIIIECKWMFILFGSFGIISSLLGSPDAVGCL